MGSEGESGREQTESGIIPEFSESREYTYINRFQKLVGLSQSEGEVKRG